MQSQRCDGVEVEVEGAATLVGVFEIAHAGLILRCGLRRNAEKVRAVDSV